MMTVIVGHRGTGKTSLGERIQKYIPHAKVIDLDKYIEDGEKQSIPEIFKNRGEAYFRILEKKYFAEIPTDENTFVIVGGGFDIDDIPEEANTLWLRRETDKDGRVFLNRPALDNSLAPLDDYLKVFPARDQKFKTVSGIYTTPEGLRNPHATEKLIVTNQGNPDGFYTLLSDTKKLSWSNTTYELRTDLLSLEDIEFYLNNNLRNQFLLSYRKGTVSVQDFVETVKKYQNIKMTDWALENGEPPEEFFDYSANPTVSLHNGELATLEKYAEKAQLKWSPEVSDFSQLAEAIVWQKEDSQHRSLLPRSKNGRWAWVRLMLDQPINFFRDGEGSSADQPTLFEWLNRQPVTNGFAAVLGSPVSHSWSPSFHESFFADKKMPFFRIDFSITEWVTALEVLSQLGLKAAAVTSPLKSAAAQWLNLNDPINTIVLNPKEGWRGYNTDTYGVNDWLGKLNNKQVALWGGEGVKPILEPLANINIAHYSSRSGELKFKNQETNTPQVLIWAAPRSPETKWPPDTWPLELVIDLNYTESSMGKELALLRKIEYISGAGFFEQQAFAQQKIWNNQL